MESLSNFFFDSALFKKKKMLSYLSSWLYAPPAETLPKAAAGLARYSNPENPIAPASLVCELASVKLRHVEPPARPMLFPPRHPVLQQLLATRKRVH
jgi:hypothetical protein